MCPLEVVTWRPAAVSVRVFFNGLMKAQANLIIFSEADLEEVKSKTEVRKKKKKAILADYL